MENWPFWPLPWMSRMFTRWFLKFHSSLSLAQYSNWFLFKAEAEEGGMKAKLWQRTYQLSIVEPLKTKLSSSTVHTNICFLTTRFKAMNRSSSFSSSKWFVSHKLTDLSDQLWDSENCLLPLSLQSTQTKLFLGYPPPLVFFSPPGKEVCSSGQDGKIVFIWDILAFLQLCLPLIFRFLQYFEKTNPLMALAQKVGEILWLQF